MLKWYVIIVLTIAGTYHLYQKNLGDKDLLAQALEYADEIPGTKTAPAIEYYVAFLYNYQEKYDLSRDTYMKLLADYPTSHYIPKAMIRMSKASKEIMDWDTAVFALEIYVESFPDGGDIEIAKSQLDKLKYDHGMQ